MRNRRRAHSLLRSAACGAAVFLGWGLALPIWEGPSSTPSCRVVVSSWEALADTRDRDGSWQSGESIQRAFKINLGLAGFLVATGGAAGATGYGLGRTLFRRRTRPPAPALLRNPGPATKPPRGQGSPAEPKEDKGDSVL